MWDGTPPRETRGSRGRGEGMPSRRYDGTPPPPPAYRAPAPNGRPDNPYRPFGDPTSSRLPAPYQRGTLGTFNRVPSVGQEYAIASGEEEAVVHRHRLGFAIFHDGNPGHLWRGSVASALGEGLLGAGMIIWLTALTLSPLVISLAVIALGIPFVLAGPLAARLERSPEPGIALRWIGRLRAVLALALIVMHFRTSLPVIYLLLFAISLCGRLHDALRVAAIRTCLVRGEPEQVANDLHIGSALASVLGPLLATLCYILLGERVLLIAIAVTAFFLISLNSESLLDTLPPNRRDFLLATPETATSGEDWPDELAVDDDAPESDDMAPAEKREHMLPAWYQLGPSGAGKAIAEIRAGLSLAGATQANAVALWALAALGVVGGALAVLEVFFVIQSLGSSPFYLGPLLAAEGAGMAVGALLGGTPSGARPWRGKLLVGLAGSGVALAALTMVPALIFVLAVCFVLGVCNALAVQAARQGLLDGFDGIERRAATAAESFVVALCAVLGTLLVAVFYSGEGLPIHVPVSLASWSAASLIFAAGAGLIAATVVFALLLSFKSKIVEQAASSAGMDSARLPALDDEDDGEYPPVTGEHDAWAESDASGWTGASRAEDDYAASYGYQRTGYGPAARRNRDEYADDDDYADDAGEYNDQPQARRDTPARRRPPQNRRPRW